MRFPHSLSVVRVNIGWFLAQGHDFTRITFALHGPSNPPRTLVTSALPYANGPIHIGPHCRWPICLQTLYVPLPKGPKNGMLCGCAVLTNMAQPSPCAPRKGGPPHHALLWTRYHEENAGGHLGAWILILTTMTALRVLNTMSFAQSFFSGPSRERGRSRRRRAQQFYDPIEQQFLADRYIQGALSQNVRMKKAFGDQCEKCGSALSPEELIGPKSTLSGATPEMRETTLWYLPMDRHEDWLREYLEQGKLDGEGPSRPPKLGRAHVLGQCRSWIDGGASEPCHDAGTLDWGSSSARGRCRRKGLVCVA